MALNNGTLQRDVQIPREIKQLLSVLGVELPDNVKEIATPVERSTETQKIILPMGMDKLQASKELETQWKNEEQIIGLKAQFENWNWQDVLVAIKRVTEREFGWMNAQATWWEGAPAEIDIVVDLKDGRPVNEKAFYGSYKITGWEGAKCSININDSGVVGISIEVKRKYNDVVTKYYNLIREQLQTASIYRGKSIRVTNAGMRLKFDIIENIPSNKIVLNHGERTVVDNFLLKGLKAKGKRTYLFTGGYGTGKTETAMEVGRVAVRQHGMSFFYLKDSAAFKMLLGQSRQYQPCVIFLEDVDEIASGESRDSDINQILNIMDGVETKGNDMTVIFTTNHPENINSALLRPGRIDQVVLFQQPDKETVAKIYELYFDGITGYDSLDYKALAKKTPEASGAVIAEIAKRAVQLSKDEGGITESTMEACIYSMEYQIKLMNKDKKQVNKAQLFFRLFSELKQEAREAEIVTDDLPY